MLKCQRKKFMLSRKEAYLNCSYMAPLTKKVENAGHKGLAKKRRPSKVSADDFFHDGETLRLLFSELINNPNPNQVVIIPSVSYGIGNVVQNIKIKKGQNVVVAGDQFPSNIYPWMRLCQDAGAELKIIAPPETEKDRAVKWNKNLMAAIDKNTVAVSIGQVHWADGTLFDLVGIRQATRKVGAALVIDGTQSVGAMPFDVQEIDPDALVCAGYKMLMGPYSIGLAYYGERFNDGKPLEENWINRFESEDFANLVNYQEAYREGALRYEVGEHSNFIMVPMMIEALKQLKKWGPSEIQEYCRELTRGAIEELRGMGLFVEQEEHRAHHLFGIKCPSDQLDELKKELKIHRVSVSFRGDFVRVSPHVYNDAKDISKLLKAFRQVFVS